MKGFTPLHPESPSLQAGDEWQIKFESTEKPRPVTKPFCNGTRHLGRGVTGFTLLEILVAVLIFTFIIGGMYCVLNVTRTNYDTNLVSLNLQRQARQGMSWLSREIRQAYWSSIVPGLPDANGNKSITFDTPDATGVKYYVTATDLPLDRKLWQLKREYPTGTVIIRAFSISQNSSTSPGLRLNFSQSTEPGHILKIQVRVSKTFRSLGKDRTLTFPLADFLTEQVEVRNP